jgi:HupE / UreJ protein
VALAVFTRVSTLGAHPMPDTIVLLDVQADGVRAEVRLPLSELEVGFGRPLPAARVRESAALRAEIGRYLAAHMSARSPDGRAWVTSVRTVRFERGPASTGLGDVDEAVVDVWLAPPTGAPVRQFTLRYDAVVHELLTHRALVAVRRDWAAGLTADEPTFIGPFAWNRKSLVVDRAAGSAWTGFAASFALGVRHIAEGTDHLLFLLALLLPAPLVAAGARWGVYGGVRRGVVRLLRIVTAFTVGHSLTLAAAATGVLHAPSNVVEALIAVSILVSAMHALRPLFPGKEALVAGGFGLVHGLAFATMISSYGIGTWQMALTVLGFNLGIELIQLVVVVATVPWLLVLARTPAYSVVRVTGALAAGVAALGWIGERAFGTANPVRPLVEGAANHGPLLVTALAALALIITALGRGPRTTT